MSRLFYGPYKDKTNFTSNDFLHINSAGLSRYVYSGRPSEFRVWRPEGRVDYQFFLVTSGEVSVQLKGKEVILKSGEGMIYYPNDIQDYTYYINSNYESVGHMYVHFCGTAVEEIMQKSGVTETMPLIGLPLESKRFFEALVNSYNAKDELTTLGNFLRLVALFSDGHSVQKSESVKLIMKEAEYINTHYAEYIDFNKSAKRCNLSRSRFRHLFSKELGVSPLKYQQKLRLEQACELLLYSNQLVTEVSEAVGFADPLYFSRLFKSQIGVSPLNYRAKVR